MEHVSETDAGRLDVNQFGIGAIAMSLTDLPLETQLLLSAFSFHAKLLTEAEAKQKLVEMYTELVVKEATYKQLLKEKWGMGNVCGND